MWNGARQTHTRCCKVPLPCPRACPRCLYVLGWARVLAAVAGECWGFEGGQKYSNISP